MDWLQALVLGIVQGLTEYLPVSSSGHLAIGSYLFGIDGEENLAFTVLVHVATVMSTFVVLWKEIDWILKGLFKFKMNDETKYYDTYRYCRCVLQGHSRGYLRLGLAYCGLLLAFDCGSAHFLLLC